MRGKTVLLCRQRLTSIKQVFPHPTSLRSATCLACRLGRRFCLRQRRPPDARAPKGRRFHPAEPAKARQAPHPPPHPPRQCRVKKNPRSERIRPRSFFAILRRCFLLYSDPLPLYSVIPQLSVINLIYRFMRSGPGTDWPAHAARRAGTRSAATTDPARIQRPSLTQGLQPALAETACASYPIWCAHG